MPLKADCTRRNLKKFVAHDTTVVRDFLANFALYVEMLEEYINSTSSTEKDRGKAKSLLLLIKNEKILMDVKLLAGITRLIKQEKSIQLLRENQLKKKHSISLHVELDVNRGGSTEGGGGGAHPSRGVELNWEGNIDADF